ncbi:MAG TPA: response regulator transcription factor [Burkholderiaceae bacterium]|jgi:DNA-binding NarL/FixJ family response regulator
MQILLIDDHPLFREGVALLLARLGPAVTVLQAGTCAAAFGQIERTPAIDLILIDLKMPGMSGMEGIAVLRDRHPDIPVVVMSSDDDMETVMRAIDQGAMGFIPKSSSSDVMIGALNLILAKGIYLPPSVFLGTQRTADHHNKAPQVRSTSGKTLDQLGLTARQADVLYLVLQGKPTKIICRELNLSASTVKTHISAVLRALNVTTRTQAVIAAGKLGLTFNTTSPM